MSFKIIAAVDSKRGLSKNGHIPWNLPEEMRYFRKMTRGKTVLMGRKTYEEIGGALPGRRNIVASRQKTLVLPKCEVINSLDVLPKDLWVIGGELFAQTINQADKLYITRINADFRCDRFFPEFESQFKLASRSQTHKENNIMYHYEVWHRNAKPI